MANCFTTAQTGKRKDLTVIILATLGLLAVSTARGVDLLEVLEIAEKEDPTYSRTQNEAAAIATLVPYARSTLFLPHLAVSASKKQIGQDIQLNSAFGAGGKTNYVATQYRINLKQPIYHHDRIVNLFQAKKKFKKAQLSVIAAHQDLIYRVATKYFDVLAAQDKLSFAKAEALSLQGQLEQAKQQFDVGLIAITDVQEAEAGYDRAVANEINAANQLENAVGNLREITGNYYRALSRLGGEVPLILPSPAEIGDWTEKAVEGNLKLAQVRLESKIRKDEITKVRSRYFPSLDIVGGHAFNKQGGRFGSSEIDSTDIGVEVSIPLFLGGEVFFKSKEEKFKYVASLDTLERTQREIEREVREAYLGVINQISLVKAFKKAVTSAESALESTKAGFHVGNRTTIDIVDAQSVLSQAKQDHAKAKYQYIMQSLKLKRVTGVLGMKDIDYVNSWLTNKAVSKEPENL